MRTTLAILAVCLLCGCETFLQVEQQIFDNAAIACGETTNAEPVAAETNAP
jgi:hypothetical protein